MALDLLLPLCGISTDPDFLNREASAPRLAFTAFAAMVFGGTASKLGLDLERVLAGSPHAAADAVVRLLPLLACLGTLRLLSTAVGRLSRPATKTD